MNPKKSHLIEVSQAELEHLEALRKSPLRAEQVAEIFQRFEQETEAGMDAYQAELHVVEATRRLGKLMVGQWAEQTENEQSKQQSEKSGHVRNGKKNSTGEAPSEGSK